MFKWHALFLKFLSGGFGIIRLVGSSLWFITSRNADSHATRRLLRAEAEAKWSNFWRSLNEPIEMLSGGYHSIRPQQET